MGTMGFAAVALLTLGAGVQQQPAPDRLYGRVVTAGGDVYEGYIRWDKNEGSWSDILNGSKDIPWENVRQAERLGDRRDRRDREHSVRVLGVRISWDEDEDDYPSSASSGIRFGHLRSIAVMGDERALLMLKSGEEVELEGGSTDLGDGVRGVVVEDAERGEVELRWRDLDVIDFEPAPASVSAPSSQRLYGTLRTRRGQEFTGYVAWDVDEILGSDVLDGEERGRDRKIPFDRIAAIERDGSSGARVILENGEEIELRGSNDVDSSNRGITIADPALGEVSVDWDAFDALTFEDPPANAGGGYDGFDGGAELYGTVETERGERYTGTIRWDNDEAYTWEILDGEAEDATFDVELGQVASIRRDGSWGSEVTLLDGRSLELEGSNDVDEDNKGIFVTLDDGETVLVPWHDFREVVFRRR
jgi:hypothetical protein